MINVGTETVLDTLPRNVIEVAIVLAAEIVLANLCQSYLRTFLTDRPGPEVVVGGALVYSFLVFPWRRLDVSLVAYCTRAGVDV